MKSAQNIVSVVVLFCFFRANAAHGTLMGLWLLLPFLRFCFSKTHRLQTKDTLRNDGRNFSLFQQGKIPIPWRSAFRVIFLPAVMLFVVNGRNIALSSYDNFGVNLATIGILERFSTDLKPYFKGQENLPYSVHKRHDGIYSSYPAGMVFFSLPLFTMSKLIGTDLHKRQWRLAKLAASCLAAFSLVILFFVMCRMGPSWQAAMWITAFLTLGSCIFSSISQGLWTNGGVIFWECVVLFALRFLKHRPKLQTFLQGLSMAQMLTCRLTSVAFIFPFLIFSFWRSPKNTLQSILWAIFLYLPWVLYYFSIYGSPLGPQAAHDFAFVFSFAHFKGGILGLLFSPGKGFLIYHIWSVLLVLYAWPAFRAQSASLAPFPPTNILQNRLTILCLALNIFLQLVAISFWFDWTGGTCWGPRLLSEMLPAVGLLMIYPTQFVLTKAHGKLVLATLLAISFFIHAWGAIGPGIDWFHAHASGNLDSWLQKQWLWKDSPILYPFNAPN